MIVCIYLVCVACGLLVVGFICVYLHISVYLRYKAGGLRCVIWVWLDTLHLRGFVLGAGGVVPARFCCCGGLI